MASFLGNQGSQLACLPGLACAQGFPGAWGLTSALAGLQGLAVTLEHPVLGCLMLVAAPLPGELSHQPTLLSLGSLICLGQCCPILPWGGHPVLAQNTWRLPSSWGSGKKQAFFRPSCLSPSFPFSGFEHYEGAGPASP